MRWLYLPNERSEGDQIGPRAAFESMLSRGELSAYEAYSYWLRGAAAPTHEVALEELLNTVERFGPDVIFAQHTNDRFPFTREYLRRLKQTRSKPKLVIYEEDAYGRVVKRLDRTMRNVLAESDMAVVGGTGYLLDLVREAGARRVRFAPHSYDSTRFDTPWAPTRTRKWDAVMIANLPCLKRVPFLHMPGGRARKQTARAVFRQLQDRFALFGGGQGWSGESYCKGPLPFHLQGETIRNAWMSVNWSHYDRIGMYCSDRLPISLACGVPHISNYQPGYEHLYSDVPGLFIVRSPAEAADVAVYLMSCSVDRRIELGLRAAEYARKKLHATVVYSDIVSIVKEQVLSERGA